jgi:hypothetical protein
MSIRQRLQNDILARILHAPLYERIRLFAQQYTPEVPAEAIASSFMKRLYDDDDSLHILVEFTEKYDIVGHAVVEVQDFKGYKIVMCHQASADKNKQSSLDEGVEYVDKLAEQVGAYCTIFMVTKHMKSLAKKYGYAESRVIMMKAASSFDEGS